MDINYKPFEPSFTLEAYYSSIKIFLALEYTFLTSQKTFNLSKINRDAPILSATLDSYFSSPMILTRAIFKALDKAKEGHITFDNYVGGLLTIYTGEIRERIIFIYKMLQSRQDYQINKEDVTIILNYTHIFSNKKNQHLLNKIINNFFGKNQKFSLSKFYETIVNQNSDLFFLFSCILIEYQKFNTSILNALEAKANSNDNFKYLTQDSVEFFCGMENFPRIRSLEDLKSPSAEALEYIINNYEYDLSYLSKEKPSDEIILNNSMNSTGEEFDMEDDEQIQELQNFENEFLETKANFFVDITSKDVLPRGGSNYYLFNSGVMTSAFSSRVAKSRMCSSKSFNFALIPKGSNQFSGFVGNSRRKIRNYSNKSFKKINSNREGASSYCEGSHCSANSDVEADLFFTEEVLVTNKKNMQKKYQLSLYSGYILVFKEKAGNILMINHSNNIVKFKKMIPIKNLYVITVEEGVVLNQTIYNKLVLGSTVKFKKEEFEFYFEDINRLHKFTKLLIFHTNYFTLKSEYTHIKVVGKGGFCQVELMKHNKTGNLYSVKKLAKNFKDLEEFISFNWERDIMTFLINNTECDNILKYHKVFESNNHLYIVMEYIESGSLGNFLSKNHAYLSSMTVREIIRQIVNGVRYLHKYGILHRDLKIENVLMSSKTDGSFKLKIIDFGLSQVLLPSQHTKEAYGTIYYCSPEILRGMPYDNRIDVWSLGIIAFYLNYAIIPFSIRGREKGWEIANKVLKNKLIIPDRKSQSESEEKNESVIQKMIMFSLVKNLKKRANSKEIYEILSEDCK